MEIHKPKPWRGWREFLKEYLIIVVGVLTALAAEAVVEELRWRDRIHQTEDHFAKNILNNTTSVAARTALQPCIDGMLDRLQGALETSGENWRPPLVIRSGPMKSVVTAPKGGWPIQQWNAALADGTVNHLPNDALLKYSGFFQLTARLARLNADETSDMAELDSLASVHRLDSVTRAQYLRLLYRIRQNEQAMDTLGKALMYTARQLSVKTGTAADYNPSAMRSYQEVCREFQAGQSLIVAPPTS